MSDENDALVTAALAVKERHPDLTVQEIAAAAAAAALLPTPADADVIGRIARVLHER